MPRTAGVPLLDRRLRSEAKLTRLHRPTGVGPVLSSIFGPRTVKTQGSSRDARYSVDPPGLGTRGCDQATQTGLWVLKRPRSVPPHDHRAASARWGQNGETSLNRVIYLRRVLFSATAYPGRGNAIRNAGRRTAARTLVRPAAMEPELRRHRETFLDRSHTARRRRLQNARRSRTDGAEQ